MARAAPPQTPTRRSRRNQPTATPSTKLNHKNIVECAWTGEPIYVRKTNSRLDSLPNELDEQPEEEEEEDAEAKETVLYDEFRMKRKATHYRGVKGMRTVKAEMQTYCVGTPVLVETDALSPVKRPPSVGIIVSMWQTRGKGEEVEEDPSKMCIRIHWFVRLSEMAKTRAEREHEENEIYYTLSSTEVITPGAILSPCTVAGVRTQVIKEKKQAKSVYVYVSKERSKPPATPSKRGPKDIEGSPLKHCTRFSPSSDTDDEDTNSDPDEREPTELDNDPDKSFYCRYAVDSRRGIFYNLTWDRHRADCLSRSKPPSNESGSSSKVGDPSTWGDGLVWDVTQKPSADAKRKGKKKQGPLEEISESEVDDSDEYEAAGSDEEEDEGLDASAHSESDADGESEEDDYDDDAGNPHTPRKRKRAQQKTPRKRINKTFVQPTPHSKAALARRGRKRGADTPTASPRKRKATFAIRHPEQSLTFQASMAHLPKDLWLRSMHALHVGSRPDVLPCREEEYARVLRCVGELLEEGSGGCVYISGVPGTGKTATVHSVVKELKRMAQNSETNPFTYVEINGLKIPEPTAAYSLLWEGISGHDVAKEGHLRVSTKESLKALTRHFTTGNRGPGGHACVVLMDELDQLVTSKQDVVYNFFNWPTLVHSRLVVIAVANTMDLPERVMTGRVRSRLGMIRINFQPYTREQLEKIVEARLRSARESLEDEDEEDVEGGMDKVIIAPDAIKLASMTVSRITGDARRVLDICRRAVELVKPVMGTVKAPHVREVVNIMQNTPTAAYLRDLSFHERLMLASLVKCIKREGVEEIKWGDVQHQHLIYMDSLPSEEDSRRKPTPAELGMVLDSLVASRAVVVEYGAAVERKHPDEKRMFLNIEQGEVEKVLSDVGGTKWKNVLGN